MGSSVIKDEDAEHRVYHGLPSFSPNLTGQTAIVTGANGISGQYMLRVLLKSPERWKKIYALSRRGPTGIDSPRVEHVSIDLLAGVDHIASELARRNVAADHVFFFAYKEVSGEAGELWAGQEQMVEANGILAPLEDHCRWVVLARSRITTTGDIPIPTLTAVAPRKNVARLHNSHERSAFQTPGPPDRCKGMQECLRIAPWSPAACANPSKRLRRGSITDYI